MLLRQEEEEETTVLRPTRSGPLCPLQKMHPGGDMEWRTARANVKCEQK